MAVDYKLYLAENVLNEQKIVTYRLLSRALKIHCAFAKQILYEFHRTENTKKPGSVNATYIVAGIPVPDTAEKFPTNGHKSFSQNGDGSMPSSPFMSSAPDLPNLSKNKVQTLLCILTREDDLNDAKLRFESISTIYVYSIQSNPIPDLNALTDVSREIWTEYRNDDPLELGVTWGMIQNRLAKRRKSTRNPPAPEAAGALVKPITSNKSFVKDETFQPKSESENDPGSSNPASQRSTRGVIKPSSKPVTMKRQGSDIFASFAKAKQKAAETNTPVASGGDSAEACGPEDVIFDEDEPSESETEHFFLDTGERKTKASGESRKEREAKLKQMMEDDDDEMPDAPESVETPKEVPPEPQAKAEPKIEDPATGRRRRGRRQVIKKKTIKDGDGYLVTVEEPVWESFSEEETLPPKKKAASSQQLSTSKKGGQGSIMSFFSRK